MTILTACWATVVAVAPYLLLGFLFAGLMSQLLPQHWVRRHLGGSGPLPVLKAATIGVPMPICSCGVIPLAASLRERGASMAATMSFLVATPQTSVDSILLCLVLIGPLFAILSPVTALLAALLAGALAMLVMRQQQPKPTAPSSTCCAAPAPQAPSCCGTADHDTTDENAEPAATGLVERLRAILHYGFWRMPEDIGREILIGVLIAALIGLYLPAGLFAETLGNGLLGKLAMVAAAVPVYVCSTSSVPVVATLIAKGVSPGTALVFFLAGPATNAATIGAVWKMFRVSGVLIYLSAVILVALLSGLALDTWAPTMAAQATATHEHGAQAGWWQHLAGIILVLILLAPICARLWPRASAKTCCH